MSNTTTYLQIVTATAPKTSMNATGALVYALLKDEASTEIYFTLLDNQGGSGCFGREIIPFARITACLEGVDLTQPIAAKRFLKAFASSRSVNNGGFLAACLRHQGLLHPAPQAAHQHVMGDNWEEWKAKMLAEPADQQFAQAATATPTPIKPTAPPVELKKGKRGAKGTDKKPGPVTASAEEPDAYPE